jgi:hypothetical protein
VGLWSMGLRALLSGDRACLWIAGLVGFSGMVPAEIMQDCVGMRGAGWLSGDCAGLCRSEYAARWRLWVCGSPAQQALGAWPGRAEIMQASLCRHVGLSPAETMCVWIAGPAGLRGMAWQSRDHASKPVQACRAQSSRDRVCVCVCVCVCGCVCVCVCCWPSRPEGHGLMEWYHAGLCRPEGAAGGAEIVRVWIPSLVGLGSVAQRSGNCECLWISGLAGLKGLVQQKSCRSEGWEFGGACLWWG